MPVRQIVTSPHFSILTPEKLIRVVPSLAIWGAGAGSALALLGSDIPLVKKDILSKVPIAGSYWAVEQPESEE
ncbi:cytochrome b-c1 complex subunit 10 [Cunninghamella echinulata]|nr:cytochrome b-c1 complex subunit 10 [Cunninghamella echinulata]